MMRSLGLGVLATVAILGCTQKGDDDDGNNVNGVTGTGGAPVTGTMTVGTGGSTGGTMTTGTGGMSVQTGSTGGSTGGGMMTMGTGGSTAGGMTMGTGGKGTAGMGTAGDGTGGMGEGTGGMGDDTTPPPPSFHPPCIKKGGDLVLIGDSYVNYIEKLEPRLTKHAQMDGVLTAPDGFDDHAVPGTSLQANAPLIPPQWYDEAKALNPKFVVMDGGGNDILLWHQECLSDGVGNDQNAGCQAVVAASMDTAHMMLTDMKASGVKQVLYYFYPDVPAGGHDILNYSYPMAKEQCEGGSDDTFECMMVDLRPLFKGHDDWIMIDGIHPLAPGMDAMGDFIWGIMGEHCMARTAAQDCGCTDE